MLAKLCTQPRDTPRTSAFLAAEIAALDREQALFPRLISVRGARADPCPARTRPALCGL
jgi:hypothetical protein